MTLLRWFDHVRHVLPNGSHAGDASSTLELLTHLSDQLAEAETEEILHGLITHLQGFFQASHACLHFLEPDDLRDEVLQAGLVGCPAKNASSEQREPIMKLESQAMRLALETRRAVHLSRMDEVTSRHRGIVTRSIDADDGIVIPLIHQEEAFGVVNVYFREPHDLSPPDQNTLRILGNMVYGAIQKELRVQAIQEGDGAIRALTQAIEAKDAYTEGHVARLSHQAEMIGKLLGMTTRELRLLRRAALLHDVGKIGVPDQVLNKPSRLTDGEFEQVKQHVLIGERIVRRLEAMGIERIANAVRSHHERWDGGGYPDGLAGEAIPRMARIISAVDAYDAMTSDRPYRNALSSDQALTELRSNAGTQFDPEVVDSFWESLSETVGM